MSWDIAAWFAIGAVLGVAATALYAMAFRLRPPANPRCPQCGAPSVRRSCHYCTARHKTHKMGLGE